MGANFFSKKGRTWPVAFLITAAVFIVGGVLLYFSLFGAVQKGAEPERFVAAQNSSFEQILDSLKSKGFIKNVWALGFAFSIKNKDIKIAAGGYKISKAMDAWALADILGKEPYMKWVVIPEGLRKEEIADILAGKLGWTDMQKEQWISVDTAGKRDYFEGVYFPETYLVPKDETTLQVAERFQAKFQEEFAPYSAEALKQNIKWTTLLKIASIIQREAAGSSDMPLIAGILWNRLDQNMKLDIDATLQYVRGKTPQGWWAPITPADKKTDSPYNTYLYRGLPPHPISNPGIGAITAVLYPSKTDCLYYLHDSAKVIHCAGTYEEHLQNIDKYLKQ